MRPDDFFIHPDPSPMGEVDPSYFNGDLVREIRSGPIDMASDVEVAVALARLVHDELEAFGTAGGEQLDDDEMREAIRALTAITKRLGIDLDVPFRDFRTFRGYWIREGASGSGGWQARRDILDGVFHDLHDDLADREDRALDSSLAEAVSPRGSTGWSRVDEEIRELKRHFASASTPQDYRNIGNDCVIVLEALSRQVYDAERHLRDGEDEPAVAKTKQRIDRFIEDAAPGSENEALRRMAKAANDFAQGVKHRPDGSRKQAGIAADTVIMLANLLRRLDED